MISILMLLLLYGSVGQKFESVETANEGSKGGPIEKEDEVGQNAEIKEPAENVEMKTIGLIGGMSWVSSMAYYRIINEKVNEK